MALMKDFRITESTRFEFRGEAFNALNHVNFNNPDGRLSDGPSFGRITSAGDPRLIQLAAKLYFAGARTVAGMKASGSTRSSSSRPGTPTLGRRWRLKCSLKHQLRVGRETLRRWMVADGLWLSRAQRRTFHQPRLRRDHGCPVAFYSDKHTVFPVNKPDAKGGSGMPQFGRALGELNIEILCANSTQAKGRVERANRTLK